MTRGINVLCLVDTCRTTVPRERNASECARFTDFCDDCHPTRPQLLKSDHKQRQLMLWFVYHHNLPRVCCQPASVCKQRHHQHLPPAFAVRHANHWVGRKILAGPMRLASPPGRIQPSGANRIYICSCRAFDIYDKARGRLGGGR